MLKRIEKLTPAEEAILAAAGTVAAGSSGQTARQRAADTLRQRGLPSRKVEAWHYTDLRTRLKAFPGLADTADEAAARAFVETGPAFVEAAVLPFVNGRFRAALADAMPQGVTATLSDRQGGFADSADAVALLNTLFGREGMDIAVAAGARVEKPVELLHGAVSDGASAVRHAVTVGAGAQATLIERHESADGLAVQASSVTDLDIGDDADLVWVIVQGEGDAATHLAQLNVRLGARAKLAVLVLNANAGARGMLVRREINVTVAGEDSELAINGVNLVGGEAHVDVTTVLLHEVPGAVSNELFRNVATDRGAGIFQGQIRVAQIAQKTDARRACNTLLLSDDAEFSAKPELEIFADDVQCAHGATVADIEDDHLFYLKARGIPEKQARAMLVQAFVEEAFEEVENEALRDALNARIEDWLAKHG
ncbi:MAG: Fe-S cluster assembly protein SufD [Pseudomonadota bacterium]|nr:Fe-S cluster assembly protein SufD [Pseudomonadota bacterium]